MGFEAKIIKHSISPDRVPICTMEVTFPRIILAEFNTHRMFSRNSASSRAVPIEKMLARVQEEPFVPQSWPSNGRGMKEGIPLTGADAEVARDAWARGIGRSVITAMELETAGLHKGYTNRHLEVGLWHTTIVTATEWDNFFHLRAHPEAHGEMQIIAAMMKEAYEASTPQKLDYGQWHLPYIYPEDWDFVRNELPDWPEQSITTAMVQISTGRCARVSYLTHDGRRDPEKDIDLYVKLSNNGHMSPFEHPARPATVKDADLDTCMVRWKDCAHTWHHGSLPDADKLWFGNFRGWVQHRKTIPYEHDMLGGR